MKLAEMFAAMSRASLEDLLAGYRVQLVDLVPAKNYTDQRAFVTHRIEAITQALRDKA